MVESVGIKIAHTFVVPALGAMPLSANTKLPNTFALLYAFVAALPLKLEPAKVWP